jgi:CheY-like chemotaxis protein
LRTRKYAPFSIPSWLDPVKTQLIANLIPDLAPMKLLIVEDNAEMRRLIVCIVRDLADSIDECADGAEALAAYTESRPDLVLMDIKMPHVDGIAASRRIMADFPDARICAVTDYSDDTTRNAARLAGISSYVTKENLFELREIVERYQLPK